jgi:toxin-antitoxin system PIN domain toxin
MRALLDINVLIALFDPIHQHHRLATRWLHENISHGWASCPLTQNGFVRILTQPGYPRPVITVEAVERLAGATATRHHLFWPDDISITSKKHFNHANIHSPRQLTDLYLLALAIHNRGRFVTFDRSIPKNALSADIGNHLVIL